MGVRGVCVAMVLLVALSGCTTTTRGQGPLPSGTQLGSTAPTPSATAPEPSTLDCPHGAVARVSAPFCYALPVGFTDNSALPTYGAGWTYKTLITAARYDLVEVLAARLPFDSDTYSDARLRAFVEPRRFRTGQFGLRRVTGLSPVRVAGARGFQHTASDRVGAALRSIYVFRGTTEVYVQCEHRDRARLAQAGCAKVLASIQIVSLD